MPLRQRQQPHRDRAYLDLAYVPGTVCMRCGKPGAEPCHYSGYLSHLVGKAGAQKCADVVSAHLCRECHTALDLYTDGNDAERAAQFLILCWRTFLKNLNDGHATLTTTTIVREATTAGATKTEAISDSRASENLSASNDVVLSRAPSPRAWMGRKVKRSRKTGNSNGHNTGPTPKNVEHPARRYHPESK